MYLLIFYFAQQFDRKNCLTSVHYIKNKKLCNLTYERLAVYFSLVSTKVLSVRWLKY